MSRVLVTGANGFIGSHVAERLLRAGHDVRGLVRPTSDLSFLDGMKVELARGDVTDAASLVPAVQGAEVVVHVAGLASDWGEEDRFFAVNLEGTRHVAEAARAAGARRLVHLSSTAIHGFAGRRDMNEETPLADTPFAYCRSKRAAEEWLREYSKTSGLEAAIVRPGNVFGPRDHTFIEKYAEALEKGKGGYVGGGASWTCPTYVENLADAIVKACFEPRAAGEVCIVTDGLPISWREFTERLADELGVERPKLSIPFWLGYTVAATMEAAYALVRSSSSPLLTRYRISNGGRDYHFSNEKARRVLGWSPAVPFDEAMRRTVAWYRSLHGPGSGRMSPRVV
jgi:nucleoside-diphosphate-sugar epimerase